MSDKDAGTPRVFLVRHGETEWTMSGRYTGRSDIPLTSRGEGQITASAAHIIGPTRLISPSSLTHIFISPRVRARKTYELLFTEADRASFEGTGSGKVTVTEDVREWDYGLYEGLLTAEIRAGRKERGLEADPNAKWNIWRDGCEEGESAAQVKERLDAVIARIRELQGPYMHGEQSADVLVVAHGHILRAFAKRWIGFELHQPLPLMLEPGAVAVCSYEHHRVDEPALVLGVNMGAKEQV